MTTLLLLITLVLAALTAGQARSHRANQHPAGELETPRIHEIYWLRGNVNRARANKCLSAISYRWKPAYRVPRAYRPMVIRQTSGLLGDARAAGSRCNVVPWWPWGALAQCESGGRWDYNGSSGFDGGLQFLPSTWNTARQLVGVNYAYAWQAPAIVQVRVAQAWLARTSWAQWPACSSALGLR